MLTFTLKDGTELPRGDFRIASYYGGRTLDRFNAAIKGVRVTHIPTGHAWQCSLKRNLHQNRAIATEKVLAWISAGDWRPSPVDPCEVSPLPHGQLG